MSKFTRLLFVLALAMPLMIAGCKKKPSAMTCKTDVECKFDATGKEVNGFCVNNLCQECVKDTDCKDLKHCVLGRCASACESDADCGSGETCADGHCTPERSAWDKGEATASGDCKNLAKVYFDFDSYEVKGEQKNIVSQYAECLKSNPSMTLVVEGHTDNRGTPTYNMVLGQQRADAVKNELKTAYGIASERVKTLSYGEQRPEDTESNEDAWQKNRRAELTLQN